MAQERANSKPAPATVSYTHLVKNKGNISALVASRFFAVYKYAAVIVHRSEVDKHSAPKLFFGQRKGAVIPDGRNKIRVYDAA